MILVALLTGIGKKVFAKSVSAQQIPGDMLMCSGNETKSGTAAAISHHMIKLKIIYCHSLRSICLLHRTNRQVEWQCGRNQQSLQSLHKYGITLGLILF